MESDSVTMLAGAIRLRFDNRGFPIIAIARSVVVPYIFGPPNLVDQIQEKLMRQPAASELTKRELEVMRIFWDGGEMTAMEARNRLASTGVDLAYVTIANLVRILLEKEYLRATNDERPFSYIPIRSREEVTKGFVGELIDRVFGGSREHLLAHLLGGNRRLSAAERKLLKNILEEQP
jgi:predicted transcriptional regulator